MEAHEILVKLIKRMYEQVENNEELKNFWEGMVEEIPDLIEWIQNIMEKGGEVAVKAAETVGEVAVETAEVAGEVALEAADVAEVVASEL